MGIEATERFTPALVLAELGACDQAERMAAARRLELAVVWAGMHRGIAFQPYDTVDSLVDEGSGVAVAAIAEFAAVHGVSTSGGRQLIGDAVALHDRLPRCWEQMTALRLPAWKARLLAQTIGALGDEATGWLDAQAAILADKLGVRTIRRLALIAAARFEPDALTDPDRHRWVTIRPDNRGTDGAAWVDGRLDTPDALDLEAALQQIAADLADQGAEADLDARRAHALGVMARHALGQPELPAATASGAGRTDDNGINHNERSSDGKSSDGGVCPIESRERPAAESEDGVPARLAARDDRGVSGGSRGRSVMLYLHLDATQLDTCTGLGELGTTGQLVTIEQLRNWCGAAGQLTVRPVIDLNTSRATRSYQPTDAMREQIALRDRTCVFPHCTRQTHPVRQRASGEHSHDADHIVPYDSGGETATDNLACLCRTHHLLKTHTRWRYRRIGPGEYLWKSPAGHQFVRTNNGTTMLNPPQQADKPEAA